MTLVSWCFARLPLLGVCLCAHTRCYSVEFCVRDPFFSRIVTDMSPPISSRPRQTDRLLRERSSHGLCLPRLVQLSFSPPSLRYFPSVNFPLFSLQASSFCRAEVVGVFAGCTALVPALIAGGPMGCLDRERRGVDMGADQIKRGFDGGSSNRPGTRAEEPGRAWEDCDWGRSVPIYGI